MKNPRRWALLGINLILMIAIAILLGWLALSWLNIWTGHGDEVETPDVKGLPYHQAVERLECDGFNVELSDSVYNNRAKPGEVVDQNPASPSMVKPGRLIYLTINAFSPKMVTLPRLTDISERQARAILEGLGIKDIRTVSVMSEYPGLVLGVISRGRRMSAGARTPVNSAITLEVGDGMPETPADSLAAEKTDSQSDRLDLF